MHPAHLKVNQLQVQFNKILKLDKLELELTDLMAQLAEGPITCHISKVCAKGFCNLHCLAIMALLRRADMREFR